LGKEKRGGTTRPFKKNRDAQEEEPRNRGGLEPLLMGNGKRDGRGGRGSRISLPVLKGGEETCRGGGKNNGGHGTAPETRRNSDQRRENARKKN